MAISSIRIWLLSPAIIFTARRFDFRKHNLWLSVGVHLLVCSIVLLGYGRMNAVMDNWLPKIEQLSVEDELDVPRLPPPHLLPEAKDLQNVTDDLEMPPHGISPDVRAPIEVSPWQVQMSQSVVEQVTGAAPLGVPLYLAIMFMVHFLQHRKELALREQTAIKLEAKLIKAEHDLLRAQLHPHFLFNTLNAGSSLVHVDPDKADTMVVQLSDLLRATLDLRNEQFVSLEKELQTVESYLVIQNTRFREPLEYSVELDHGLLGLLVPPMLLMPMVENAIRYAVERQRIATSVKISASRKAGMLELVVEDSGKGVDAGHTAGTGVGMANIESRIQTLYPDSEAAVSLENRKGGGAIAKVLIPCRTE